jgi:DNA repair protein RadC
MSPVNYRITQVRFTVCREGAVSTTSKLRIDQPLPAAQLARELIVDDAREHFWAIYLNARNRMVATHEVSVGTLSSSLVHPREVFGPALRLLGVASVILAHNHPSGDPTPSREDIRLTRQLADAGRLLDIKVHDHVILGDGGQQFISLAERGLV